MARIGIIWLFLSANNNLAFGTEDEKGRVTYNQRLNNACSGNKTSCSLGCYLLDRLSKLCNNNNNNNNNNKKIFCGKNCSCEVLVNILRNESACRESHQQHTQRSSPVQESTTLLKGTTLSGTVHDSNDAVLGHKGNGQSKCDSPELETPIVSVGLAVGLLFLGLATGSILSSLVCICVPSLHSKSSIIRKKMRGNVRARKLTEDTDQTRHYLDQTVTQNTLPPETTNRNSANGGNSTDLVQGRYQALNTVSRARNSHTYTGLKVEPTGKRESMEGGNSYETTKIQPMGGPNAITSPIYQEFTDNIIPNKGKIPEMNNQNPITGNQPIRTTDTEDDAANHDYFVLELQIKADNSKLSRKERPLSDHPYFVLEEQNEKQVSTDITGTTEPNDHEYFVLQNEQT